MGNTHVLPPKPKRVDLCDRCLLSVPMDELESENLSHITELRLANNKLSELPLALSQCTNLKFLDLSGNRFKVFPEVLFRLPRLEMLSFSNNQLEFLPNLRSLKHLKSIDLGDNLLSEDIFPSLLMGTLKHVQVEKNYIEVSSVPMHQRHKVVMGEYAQKTPTKILPKLFLGCAWAAACGPELKKRRISHILNATTVMKPAFPSAFKYLVVEIEDASKENIEVHLDAAADFIAEGIAADGVLVHCAAGVSRSASFIIAYLMRTNRWGYDEALKFIVDRRYSVCPNRGFEAQLRLYEKKCLSATPTPTIPNSIPTVSKQTTTALEPTTCPHPATPVDHPTTHTSTSTPTKPAVPTQVLDT